jgi:hypothetical protein
VSNHAHRHPEPPPPQPSFLRRLFGLKAAKPAKATVGFASSRVDAELMVGYLRSQGVHAVLSADDECGLNPALAAGDRVRILTPHHQHAAARKLLEERG